MRRWAAGSDVLRALVSLWGGTARPARSGPLFLIAADAEESARLAETVDGLAGGEADQATVVVAAGFSDSPALWKRLGPVLDECRRSRINSVRLLWAGAGADLPQRPAPARRVRDTWAMQVIAPAGPVIVTPDGSLFTPTGPGGWYHFVPGLRPRPLGLRHPVPSWEDAAAHLAPDAVGGHVVEPVPAGVLLRGEGAVSDAERAVAASLPVDEHRLAVVVGTPGTSPVSPSALAELLALLPSRARAGVRLVPGNGHDLLATAQQTADLLGTEVEVLSGVPALLERADGTGTDRAVVLIGPDGEPSWRPYAEAVACLPAHDGAAPAPRLLQWRPPVAGLPAAGDGVFVLDALWRVAITRAGLWVGAGDGVPPQASGQHLARDTMTVHVGIPGQRLDDDLWPALGTLVERIEPSVRERMTLSVLGRCSVQGLRLLQGVTERQGVALEYRRDTAADLAADTLAENMAEPERPSAAARTETDVPAIAEAPWHAQPMSVRIRRVAAPPVSAPRTLTVPAPQASVAPIPHGLAASASPIQAATAVQRTAVGPIRHTPATPVAATRKALVPPGFAQAVAESRSAGEPGGHSLTSHRSAAREAGAQVPTAPDAPTSARSPAADPAPPVLPISAVAPPPSPAPAPTPARTTTPEPSAIPPRRAVRPVPITPLHRSTPADRQALQALAGEQWWQQQAAISRTLMVVPGLRPRGSDDESHTDLIAVRSFLTLDDGPLSWTWLERRLAAGAEDILPYLSCLASGLRRLPSYRGVVVRDAGVLPAEARTPAPGSELREAGPVGTLALDGAPVSEADRYLIWSVTGRRARGLFASTHGTANGEEVVFAPGTRFRVLGMHGRTGATSVFLREVAEGDPAARAGRHEAQDRGALAALTQAVDHAPGAAASWPPRLAGQLAERPLGSDHA
ncbi:hypothetical protein [Streptomyces bauhiniae]|uniref:hypothetical protein n=1 Tax=Streptomyces bauhiniae TaxID=2340725 RepID=UPI0035DE6C19